MRWWVLVLLSTLLACTTPVRPPPTFSTAEAALAAAEQDVEAGRWQAALTKLRAAERQFADQPDITARRIELTARWKELRADWRDRLTLVRAQSRWDELVLLQRLELAETGVLRKLELEQKRALLIERRRELIDCAERQMNRDLKLAKSCAVLADSVQTGKDSSRLRAEVTAKQAAAAEAELAVVAAEQAQERKAAKARRVRKLDQAREFANDEKYVRALALVQQVLEDEPNNQRARALKSQLQENLSWQSRQLSELAERMYGESNVEAAIKMWEASLRLVPNQPEVIERYERAKRVQGNLRQLRDSPRRTPDAARQSGP